MDNLITKKLDGHTWVWDPLAFMGKGYWFMLGKNGNYGRAASKKEAASLGKIDKTETEPASEKVYKQEKGKPGKESEFAKAGEIRKKGFSKMVAEKLASGQSLGKSLKSTISEKTKAKAVGMREKFNPMNIAKGMFGEAGAMYVGKKMGAKKEDIEYFSDTKIPNKLEDEKAKKKKSKEPESEPTATKVPSAGKSNATTENMSDTKTMKGSADTIIVKLYELLKKNFDDKKTQDELMKDFEQERKNTQEKRHKELIEAIKSRGDGKGLAEKIGDKVKEAKQGFMEKLISGLGKMFEIFEGIGAFISMIAPLLAGLAELFVPILAVIAAVIAVVALFKLGKWLWNKFKGADKKADDVKKDIPKEVASGDTATKQSSASGGETPSASPTNSGANGASGSNGSSGMAGAAGSDGSSGTSGAPGASPSASSAGAPGSAGAAGSSSSGAPGSAGAAGSPGAAGAPGSAGSVGSVGAAGASATASPTSAPTATPTASPSSLGSKMTAATKENNDAQLQSSGSSTPTIINNTSSKGMDIDPPDVMTGNFSVRNDDSAFMRVLRMNTRAV